MLPLITTIFCTCRSDPSDYLIRTFCCELQQNFHSFHLYHFNWSYLRCMLCVIRMVSLILIPVCYEAMTSAFLYGTSSKLAQSFHTHPKWKLRCTCLIALCKNRETSRLNNHLTSLFLSDFIEARCGVLPAGGQEFKCITKLMHWTTCLSLDKQINIIFAAFYLDTCIVL